MPPSAADLPRSPTPLSVHVRRSRPATPSSQSAANQPARQRFAYCTLLTKDAYLPGVQALFRSLRLVEACHPLIVLYTEGVSQEALDCLAGEGMMLHFTEQFQAEGVDHSEYKRSLYLQCWNKLRMWEMTQYDRLVYLDADMILLQNIDHLFDLPPGFYAVGDCYGGREFEEERTSCCHFTPEAPPQYFNAGFYVMAPGLAELEGMKAALAEGRCPVRFFAEQDFLNGYFKGRWRHLPYTFNAQKRIKYHHPGLWSLGEIKVIHYVDEKPWSHRCSEENLAYKEECDYWWDVFEGRLAPRTPSPERAADLGAPTGEQGGAKAEAAEKAAKSLELSMQALSLAPSTPLAGDVATHAQACSTDSLAQLAGSSAYLGQLEQA